MEKIYSLTTWHDGKLINTMQSTDMIKVMDAWHKCVDSGDSKDHAIYNLSHPDGRVVSKSFNAKKKGE
jgi:hypothetical protein